MATFAFWMSLKVVMAVFPLNTIFLGHSVYKSLLVLLDILRYVVFFGYILVSLDIFMYFGVLLGSVGKLREF